MVRLVHSGRVGRASKRSSERGGSTSRVWRLRTSWAGPGAIPNDDWFGRGKGARLGALRPRGSDYIANAVCAMLGQAGVGF